MTAAMMPLQTESPLMERARAFVKGRERLLSMAVGALAGFAFLLGTAATGIANGCVAPAMMASLDVATLI